MQDQQGRKEGYELLRDAAKDVLSVSDEEWDPKKGDVTRKLWEQVRSRLDEAMPEEHVLDVMDFLLQAEMRIAGADAPMFAPWSNRMLVERLGEGRLDMMLSTHGDKWRLVGKAPKQRILPAELADLYERVARAEEKFGSESPECRQAARELRAWLNRQALVHAISNMSRRAKSLEGQARRAFLQPDLIQVEVSVGDPADLPGALEQALSLVGRQADDDLPEHIGSILQGCRGLGFPGMLSGSLAIDMANGLISKDQLREMGRQRRAGMEAYLAEHPEEPSTPLDPPETLEPPPSGEDAYREGDENQSAQPGGTVDTDESGIDYGAP